MCECDHIPGFWGGLPGAIVAGAGGVMLVGGLATRSCDQVPPKNIVPLISYLKADNLSILKGGACIMVFEEQPKRHPKIFPIWMCCVTETEPAAVSYHFPLYTGETKLAASDVASFHTGHR